MEKLNLNHGLIGCTVIKQVQTHIFYVPLNAKEGQGGTPVKVLKPQYNYCLRARISC